MSAARTTITLAFAIAVGTSSARTFVHPGAMETQAELDFVKARITEGAEPWTSAFGKLKALATAYTRTEAPADGAEAAQKADGRKAYANALAWSLTGESKYADQAIAVLNVWGKTFLGYTLPPANEGNQSQLNAAWIGALLGPAAELMRGYSGWKPEDLESVQNMFRSKFYPLLNQMSPWNGNVDLTQIDAMMNIAVFNEDETLFDAALERLKKRDTAYFFLSTDRAGARTYGGSDEAAWSDANGNPPTAWVDGLTQETCRDNGHHAQYAMASAFHAAEIAWHQGTDVYTPNAKRYTAALELLATQILTGNMQGTCQDSVATKSLFDTWEIGYTHFHGRKGVDLPNTKRLIAEKIRPKGISDWNIFFETLTHADLEEPRTGIKAGMKRSGSFRILRGGVLEISPRSTGWFHASLNRVNGRRTAERSLQEVANTIQRESVAQYRPRH
jgi:Alginate lyase